ncbi:MULTISPECIES: DUF3291 domain-containing protein [Streptomyces]|uniref:DUF3291 domain-containing protein n=1 Tax=Streptomyces sudanensis TaxID=436397 RepID=A0ABY4TFJ8_9ACTN|nr:MULTISPECIES: DUF3291 domain-containing protein [Streptomyces]MCP9956925.1 DUF3291 domain-containing protein [Streptomyces sudanensis]MCQ0002491.1 DUF3291 domain-containing protein [Streptomyces sudanensis]URN17261.1 DUF3291 domain-containing protein [Streptomyces sudanensis]
MPRVAFTTFAILKKPYGNPEVQEFDDLTPPTFEEAERSPGFIARAKEDPGQSHLTNFQRDWGEWGRFDVPRFYTGGRTDETDSRASTLSLWTDLDSVFSFVYAGLHRSTLRKRHEWFLKPEWPTYAAWWVSDDTIPTWSDACSRLEHLHDHGPTPVSFTFRRPFAPDGTPTRLRGAAGRRETSA